MKLVCRYRDMIFGVKLSINQQGEPISVLQCAEGKKEKVPACTCSE